MHQGIGTLPTKSWNEYRSATDGDKTNRSKHVFTALEK